MTRSGYQLVYYGKAMISLPARADPRRITDTARSLRRTRTAYHGRIGSVEMIDVT